MPIDVHAHYIPPQLIDSIDRSGSDIGVRLVFVGKPGCKYAPNIDPTSSSAHPVDMVWILRKAEDPAPALVATPHEAQKTILDQTLRSKTQ